MRSRGRPDARARRFALTRWCGVSGLAVLLAACSNSVGGSDPQEEPAAEPQPEAGGAGPGRSSQCDAFDRNDEGNLALEADAANNYSFSSSLDIDVQPVAPGVDLTFDWSRVTRDFRGYEVQPEEDIDLVTLVLWKLTEEELEARLNDDSLAQKDTVAFAVVYPEDGQTSAQLFDFTGVTREPIEREQLLAYFDPDLYDPDSHVFTVMVEEGTQLGRGTRTLQGMRLGSESDTTDVQIDDESTQLEFSVDLHSSKRTYVPAGESDIDLDWGSMTVNAMGREFIPTNIQEVLVAHFSETPEELEGDKFLKLRTIADDLWSGPVLVGNSIVFSSLVNEAGEAFEGIDDAGTWLVALVCTRCRNPAPWYISILEPCR